MARPAHPVCSAFGRHLQRLRSEKGWTQEQLAFEADLDRSYVGQVERGERNIALINIAKLAHALGVGLAVLMPPES